MKSKKYFAFLIICALAIGFASITASLYINGSVDILPDPSNFEGKVVFKDISIENGTIESGEGLDTITFSTNDFMYPGDNSVLTYKIENTSNYSANITGITCRFYNSETSEYDLKKNDYISFSFVSEFFPVTILKDEITDSTTLTVKLLKTNPSGETINTKYQCKLDSTTDTTAEGTGDSYEPILYNMMKKNYKTTTINFNKNSSVSNTNGIYMTTDTDSGNPVYYYRGNVNNNVIFNNMCWKIIRTTETGGVKLIYNGLPSDGKCENTGENSIIGDEKYSLKNNDNTYVGYMHADDTNYKYVSTSSENETLTMSSTDSYYYGSDYVFDETTGTYSLSGTSYHWDETFGKYEQVNVVSNGTWNEVYLNHYTCLSTSSTGTCTTLYYLTAYNSATSATATKYTSSWSGSTSYDNAHANTINSDVKTTLDNWYFENFTDDEIKNQIEDTVYCNDRSVYEESEYGTLGYGDNDTDYSAYGRSIASKLSPTLKCKNDNDKFTVDSSIGNGALSYPVGLITLDEALFAGFNTYSASSSNYHDINNYLYNGYSYWTMTPAYFYEYDAAVYYIYENGTVYTRGTNYSIGIRPVISLKETAQAGSGGEGTEKNPYIIK